MSTLTNNARGSQSKPHLSLRQRMGVEVQTSEHPRQKHQGLTRQTPPILKTKDGCRGQNKRAPYPKMPWAHKTKLHLSLGRRTRTEVKNKRQGQNKHLPSAQTQRLQNRGPMKQPIKPHYQRQREGPSHQKPHLLHALAPSTKVQPLFNFSHPH